MSDLLLSRMYHSTDQRHLRKRLQIAFMYASTIPVHKLHCQSRDDWQSSKLGQTSYLQAAQHTQPRIRLTGASKNHRKIDQRPLPRVGVQITRQATSVQTQRVSLHLL